jgi:hypothetical protein
MILVILRLVMLISVVFPVALSAQLQLASEQVPELVTIDRRAPLEIRDQVKLKEKNLFKSFASAYSTSILYPYNKNVIPSYQPRHYGVFCRIESRIEKKSIISPRFRLGSSAYVDMLEGKR